MTKDTATAKALAERTGVNATLPRVQGSAGRGLQRRRRHATERVDAQRTDWGQAMSQYAWHFITEDWRSAEGKRKPWKDGAIERHRGELAPCRSGLHSSPTAWDALQYAPGPLLSLVEIPDVGNDCIPHGDPVDKHVSRWRRRVQTIDLSRELRQFACDVAEEALNREEQAGRTVDERSRAAIEVARRYANGQADREELAAARDAAWAAAWDAAGAAHRQKFNALIETLFAEARP